jgi:hypothetical protein
MTSTRRTKPKPATRSKKPKPYRPSGAVAFPQGQGKTLADVYLTTDTDVNCLTLRFDDNTELVVDIEPCFIFSADYSDWKTGNQRVIKRWPRFHSDSFV